MMNYYPLLKVFVIWVYRTVLHNFTGSVQPSLCWGCSYILSYINKGSFLLNSACGVSVLGIFYNTLHNSMGSLLLVFSLWWC